MIDDLPPHIILKIFQYMTVNDLCTAHRVCRLWNSMLTDWASLLPIRHLRRIEFNHEEKRMPRKGYWRYDGVRVAVMCWMRRMLAKRRRRVSINQIVAVEDCHDGSACFREGAESHMHSNPTDPALIGKRLTHVRARGVYIADWRPGLSSLLEQLASADLRLTKITLHQADMSGVVRNDLRLLFEKYAATLTTVNLCNLRGSAGRVVTDAVLAAAGDLTKLYVMAEEGRPSLNEHGLMPVFGFVTDATVDRFARRYNDTETRIQTLMLSSCAVTARGVAKLAKAWSLARAPGPCSVILVDCGVTKADVAAECERLDVELERVGPDGHFAIKHDSQAFKVHLLNVT
uniref:F-box domain-containing protein n=1 Tax=Plectus sambesii TaxID=2011161 RepID=A0A914W393_9BILA